MNCAGSELDSQSRPLTKRLMAPHSPRFALVPQPTLSASGFATRRTRCIPGPDLRRGSAKICRNGGIVAERDESTTPRRANGYSPAGSAFGMPHTRELLLTWKNNYDKNVDAVPRRVLFFPCCWRGFAALLWRCYLSSSYPLIRSPDSREHLLRASTTKGSSQTFQFDSSTSSVEVQRAACEDRAKERHPVCSNDHSISPHPLFANGGQAIFPSW